MLPQANNAPGVVKEDRIIELDLPEGVPPLTMLYLYIAGSCNLACRHCWISPNYIPGGKGGQFLPLEYVDKAIREGLPIGLSAIKLTGGEPLLHPEFRELVTLIARAGLNVYIETNGTLIDAELAAFLKDYTQVCFISVSLDGATVATHEALRLVICTLHRGNVGEISQVVSLAQSLNCSSIKFNHVQSSGRGENMAKEEGLSVPELIELYHYVESDLVPAYKIPIFFDIPFAFRPIREFLQGNTGRCDILHILGILAGGELSLCGIGVTVPELIFGNIATDNLADIWYNNNNLKVLRGLIPYSFEGICGGCLHQEICLGDCIANTYQQTKTLNDSYYFCVQAEKLKLFPVSRRK
jgi:radical SAM protein with 4Fe4S-binding SPASM domain